MKCDLVHGQVTQAQVGNADEPAPAACPANTRRARHVVHHAGRPGFQWLLSVTLAFLSVHLEAAVHVFDAGAFLDREAWSNGFNWEPNTVPPSGPNTFLLFGDCANVFGCRISNEPVIANNDLQNLEVASLQFTDLGFGGPWRITGNPLGIRNGIDNADTSVNRIELDVKLTDSSAFFSSSGGELVLDGDISGDGLLRFGNAGSTGRVILGGTATHTGATFVDSGELRTGTASLPANTQVILADGASWSVGEQVVSRLAGAGRVNLSSLLIVNERFAADFSGTIRGEGAFQLIGPGQLTFSNENSYTGRTDIRAGTLRLAHHLAIRSGNQIQIEASATLDYNGGGSEPETRHVLTGTGRVTNFDILKLVADDSARDLFLTLDGPGGADKVGLGTLTLRTNALYTGGTTVSQGTLRLANDGSLARGNLAVREGALFQGNGLASVVEVDQLSGFGDVVDARLAVNNGLFDGSLLGETRLEKYSPGFLTVRGESDYISTDVVGGTLALLGAVTTGQLRIGPQGSVLVADNSVPVVVSDFFDNEGVLTLEARTLTAHHNSSSTSGGSIFGTGPITSEFVKEGSGNLTLTGVTAGNLDVVVRSGRLTIGSDAFEITGQLKNEAGGFLDIGSHSVRVGDLAGQSLSQIVGDGGTITVRSAGSDYLGSFSGKVSLNVEGGTLGLSSTFPLTGKLHIEQNAEVAAETLIVGALSGTGRVTATRLTFRGSEDSTFSGVISPDVDLQKTGLATQTLSADLQTNSISVNNGALRQISGLIDSGRIFVGRQGSLQLQGGGLVTADTMLVNGKVSSGAVRIGGAPDVNSLNAESIDLRSSQFGTIQAEWLAQSLLMDNGGLLTIANGGHMQVSNSAVLQGGATLVLDDGEITAPVLDVRDASLTGIGSINADLLLGETSVVSPGSSPGRLIVNGDLRASGTTFDMEVFGLEAGEFDVIEVLGSAFLEDVVFRFDFSQFAAEINPEELVGTSFRFLEVEQQGQFSDVMTEFIASEFELDFDLASGSVLVQSVIGVPTPTTHALSAMLILLTLILKKIR